MQYFFSNLIKKQTLLVCFIKIELVPMVGLVYVAMTLHPPHISGGNGVDGVPNTSESPTRPK